MAPQNLQNHDQGLWVEPVKRPPPVDLLVLLLVLVNVKLEKQETFRQVLIQNSTDTRTR